MLEVTQTKAPGLSDLPAVESDSLLELIALANADERPEKIDVGVGVFRDGEGNTPILKVIKDAERRLVEEQETKAYVGGRGDRRFAQLIRPIVLGDALARDDRIAGIQTPGGCGALRLGFQLIADVHPQAKVLVGTPTWPNHEPLIRGVGLEIVEYPYYDRDNRRIRFDSMVGALEKAEAGSVVLLHGCCHNPTGADLDDGQWDEVTEIIARRGLLPFIDIAYQGFGRGLEPDARGLRGLFAACDEAIAAQSCDKNFSVYRDRVGSLWIKTGARSDTEKAIAHVLQDAREMWSMPPDHGAAAVRIVLDDPDLRQRWFEELEAMRSRINRVRSRIAQGDPRLAYIGEQHGMFSLLPINKAQVRALREQAIYLADSGRFNVVGMADDEVDRFIAAIAGVMDG